MALNYQEKEVVSLPCLKENIEPIRSKSLNNPNSNSTNTTEIQRQSVHCVPETESFSLSATRSNNQNSNTVHKSQTVLVNPSDPLHCTSPTIVKQNGRRTRQEHGTRHDSQVPSYKDFVILKPISRGAFGKVFLGCKKNNPKKKYAIKIMKKADMVHKTMVNQVIAERNALALSKSPFIVRLYYSLQSQVNIYLVMEYMIGGDMKSLLAMYGFFDEDMALLYTAEIVLALEYLHSHGIVHRDLKPDNMLISREGHIKLTDFGLSKVSLNRQINIGDVMNTPNINREHSVLMEDYLRTPGQILSLTSDFAFSMPYEKPILNKVISEMGQSMNNCVSVSRRPCPVAVHSTPPPIQSLTPVLKESISCRSSETSAQLMRMASRTSDFSTLSRLDDPMLMRNSTPRSCQAVSLGLVKSYAAQNLKSLCQGSTSQPVTNYTSPDEEVNQCQLSFGSLETRRLCNSGESPQLNVKKLCFLNSDINSGQVRNKRSFMCVEKSPVAPKSYTGSRNAGLTDEFTDLALGDEHRLKRPNSDIERNDSTVPSQKLDFSHVHLDGSLQDLNKERLHSSGLSDIMECDRSLTGSGSVKTNNTLSQHGISEQDDFLNDKKSSKPFSESGQKSIQSSVHCSEQSKPDSLDSSQPSGAANLDLSLHSMSIEGEIYLPPGDSLISDDNGDLPQTDQSCPKVLRFASVCDKIDAVHLSTANDADVSDLSGSVDSSMFGKSGLRNTSTCADNQDLMASDSTSDQADDTGQRSEIKDEVDGAEQPLLPFKVMRFSSLPGLVSTDNESSGVYSTPMRSKNSNMFMTPATNYRQTPRRTPKSVRRGPLHKNEAERILGTPDYLAPELLLQKEHGYAVDWWALGVCLYEFLTGVPPFNDVTPEKVFQNILSRDLLWPEGDEALSPEAHQAIERLLDMSPRTRADHTELKQMVLMEKVDWENLLTCVPLFVPSPDDDSDTTYFDARNTLQNLKVSAVDINV